MREDIHSPKGDAILSQQRCYSKHKFTEASRILLFYYQAYVMYSQAINNPALYMVLVLKFQDRWIKNLNFTKKKAGYNILLVEY